jgi:ribosomal protein S18 acetylase RimI-like enzyme
MGYFCVTSVVTIRRGQEEDVPDAVRMGLAFRQAHATHLRENPTQMAAIARFLLTPPHVLLMATVDRAVIGMLGMAVVPHPLSGDLTGSELFWWVDPPARSLPAGPMLLDAAETWARAQGATTMQMVCLASNPYISRVYAKRGYTERDTTWERTL